VNESPDHANFPENEMKDVGHQVAMDGFTAATLQKALDGRMAARIKAVESEFRKGLTAANLQAGLASVP
jgi:hypothetical protein